MDLQQLKIFLTVASLKSFSRAAERLYISQPGVSTRIKALEEELGTALFDRSRSRELTLTEAGKVLLDYAQRLVNLQEEALEKLAREAREVTGTVQLGASTVPGIYLLPPLMAKLQERFPGLVLSVTVSDTATVLEKLVDYDYDLGLVGDTSRDERLFFTPLAEDELVVIAPPGLFPHTPSKDVGTVTLESCLPHRLLIREEGSATRRVLEKALAEKNLSLRDFASVSYINSLEGIKEAVRYGLGISLVSRRAVEVYCEAGLVCCLRVAGLDLKRRLYLAERKNRVLSRAARATRAFLLDQAESFS